MSGDGRTESFRHFADEHCRLPDAVLAALSSIASPARQQPVLSASCDAETQPKAIAMLYRILAMTAITVTSAAIQGALSYRWSSTELFQPGLDLINAIPKQLGDWQYVDDAHTMRPAVIRELGVTAYVSRRYSNGRDTVSLLFMTGKTARLIRHTPDICYSAIGNTFLSPPAPHELNVDGVRQRFLTLPIRPSDSASADYVVIYGFLHHGVFSATRTPRLDFHGEPRIEKIQVLCEIDSGNHNAMPAAAADFISELCRFCQGSQHQSAI